MVLTKFSLQKTSKTHRLRRCRIKIIAPDVKWIFQLLFECFGRFLKSKLGHFRPNYHETRGRNVHLNKCSVTFPQPGILYKFVVPAFTVCFIGFHRLYFVIAYHKSYRGKRFKAENATSVAFISEYTNETGGIQETHCISFRAYLFEIQLSFQKFVIVREAILNFIHGILQLIFAKDK